MINFWKYLRVGIKAGDVYAIQTGDYVGEMWVFMEKINDNYHFLSIQKMKNREVPKEKFDIGVKNGIVEHVESVPRSFFKVVKRQYEENKNKF